MVIPNEINMILLGIWKTMHVKAHTLKELKRKLFQETRQRTCHVFLVHKDTKVEGEDIIFPSELDQEMAIDLGDI